MSIEELPKSTLVQRVKNFAKKGAKTRELAERKAKQGFGIAINLGSAWGTGWATKEFPDMRNIPNTEIPMAAAVGGSLLLLGLTGMAGDQSEYVLEAGKGVGGGFLALKGAGVL